MAKNGHQLAESKKFWSITARSSLLVGMSIGLLAGWFLSPQLGLIIGSLGIALFGLATYATQLYGERYRLIDPTWSAAFVLGGLTAVFCVVVNWIAGY